MGKCLESLKILLLQIRDDDTTRREELQSFARMAGVAETQIDVLNVFDTPEFAATAAQGYDALWVGGSSSASVLEPDIYSFVPYCERLLLQCIADDTPVFASCFGFQLAVTALQGDIVHQPVGFEMGTVAIRLTDQARQDPLMHDATDGFYAVSVHQQKALQLPEGCQLLAYTESCCHIFRVQDKPFWAFQFHPEVDEKILIHRLGLYRHKYTDNDEHYQQIISRIHDTAESNAILAKFVQRILLGRA